MRYDVPIFDPFGERGDDNFHPANAAAEHFTQVAFIYADIAVLFRILNRSPDEREEKLISKFIVVEFLSLDEHLTALVGMALSGLTGYPLNADEAEQLKRLNGHYTALRKAAEPAFREIRNKVAAHRDRGNLLKTARIWDGIDAGAVFRMAEPVNALYYYLHDLNIYEWTKTEETDKGNVTAHVRPMMWEGLEIEKTDDTPPAGSENE